jgi:hypothetical protein
VEEMIRELKEQAQQDRSLLLKTIEQMGKNMKILQVALLLAQQKPANYNTRGSE